MLGGDLAFLVERGDMSVGEVLTGGGNVLHPQAPRPGGDPTCLMEVDTEEVTVEVAKAVVVLSLGAATEADAQIVGTVARANGHTIEFASQKARDAAVKATREYGQLPCTRAAESPSWRNLTRVHAIDCVSWVQGSKCSLDGQCPFRHPPPVARVPCRHWIRNHGECWYAEHCNFLHPGSATLRTHDGRGQHGGDGGSGPAAIMSPPIPMTQRRPGPVSNPWGPSTSAIPMAATSLPSSPREIPGGGNTHRVIGSPWTSRAASSTARPPSPDVFGRPAHRRDSGGVPDHVFGSALSSSISSVDDEIVNGSGMSRTNPTDTTPVPPHPTPRGRGTVDEDEAIVPASVAAVWQRPRFESKQRLDFGLIPVGGSEDESATISALRLQLNAKDAEIARLTEALLSKDQQIAVLSTQLAECHEQPSQ
eukprot:m.46317 g.46317  ORF g.46317 m.46317 type:complete len:422 (-) comp8741_c1_seq1:1759-3024(-)